MTANDGLERLLLTRYWIITISYTKINQPAIIMRLSTRSPVLKHSRWKTWTFSKTGVWF